MSKVHGRSKEGAPGAHQGRVEGRRGGDRGIRQVWQELGRRRRALDGGPARRRPWLEDEPSSSLGRLYEDVAENGRLSQPPESPTRLMELAAADEEDGFRGAAARDRHEPSPADSVELYAGPSLDDVFDELDEGSVRLPGARHDSTAPADDDQEWLGPDGMIPT